MNLLGRWEWRGFGEHFDVAEECLRAGAREEPPSEEIYLISPWTDLDVSIRHGMLDVKSLEATNASGLEKWRRAPQLQFPLEPSAVAALLDGWHIEHRPFVSKRRFSEVRLLALLGDIAPSIAVIPVMKRRRVGSLSGCLVELTSLDVEGQTLRTLAIAHEDASRVMALVTTLGYDAVDNTNYVSELRRVHATHGSPLPLAVNKASEEVVTAV